MSPTHLHGVSVLPTDYVAQGSFSLTVSSLSGGRPRDGGSPGPRGPTARSSFHWPVMVASTDAVAVWPVCRGNRCQAHRGRRMLTPYPEAVPRGSGAAAGGDRARPRPLPPHRPRDQGIGP